VTLDQHRHPPPQFNSIYPAENELQNVGEFVRLAAKE